MTSPTPPNSDSESPFDSGQCYICGCESDYAFESPGDIGLLCPHVKIQ
jgi:hypothetical protein